MSKRECPCGERGKDLTLNHDAIVGTIRMGRKTWPVCGNHLDNYSHYTKSGEWKFKPLTRKSQ